MTDDTPTPKLMQFRVPGTQILAWQCEPEKNEPELSPQNLERFNVILGICEAWSSLNPSIFKDVLDENDFVYSSYWVLESMNGKQNYLEYIHGKFNAISRSNSPAIVAKIARISMAYFPLKYTFAVELTQNDDPTLLVFEFKKTKICKMTMVPGNLFDYTIKNS